MRPRAVCSVDLDALAANLDEVRRVVGSSVRICAVVKADAYGHGALPVAAALVERGVEQLAVACLEEAIELRDAGIRAPLLVFGGVRPEDARLAVERELDVVVWDPGETAALGRALPPGRRLRVHLKVETGMNRIGAALGAIPALADALRSGPFEVRGLMSHVASAEDPAPAAIREPLARLEEGRRAAAGAGLRPPLRHLAGSAALLADRSTHLDMVRPGLLLYGCLPHPRFAGRIALEPVMRLRTWVAQVKDLRVGEGVGYGHRFVTRRPTRLAILPVGYGQGYPRALSDRGEVLVRGRRAPVVGAVSMDHTTVDVTDVPGVSTGDEVLLWGRSADGEIDVMELACRAGTIGYELLARVGGRVAREARRRPARASGGGKR